MFTVELAKLAIGIENRFAGIEQMCKDYKTENGKQVFSVCTTDQSLENERSIAAETYSDEYLETLSVYREIGTQLPYYDAFLFHAAVIEMNGNAYAFTAPSGTGKTTHIRHWRSVYGKAVLPINGDKPIFRYIGGVLHACGTPWAGKENLHRNVCVPLAGVCFLHRKTENHIRQADGKEVLTQAFSQIFLPKEPAAAEKTLILLDRMLGDVPLWELECKDSADAAILAKETIVV